LSIPPGLLRGSSFHDWNLEKKKALDQGGLQRAAAKRALIAVENIIDEERRENAFGLLKSLNMLIEFGDAFDFSDADFWGWSKEAGFKSYEVLHLVGPCSAAIAYK
jgi:hypothetical protein